MARGRTAGHHPPRATRGRRAQPATADPTDQPSAHAASTARSRPDRPGPDWPAEDWSARVTASIIGWADNLAPAALEGDLTWHSNAVNRDISKPKWLLVTQLFNHQTHHRGQVHCMLTQAGGKPHDTDLQYMPE